MANAAPMPPSQLPPTRDTSAIGTQLATLPPSATPKDEYDMAYGYVLHKDYALAEQAFRDFLRKYPDEKLVPDAQYWLGESLFQRQRYRDAAESFLAVSTKFEHAGKAPDALLRLGQSLAALNQKEAACATLAEVGRKFPRASASVKRGVTQEQKRAHC
jgi:tol-pal system protein YbgF